MEHCSVNRMSGLTFREAPPRFDTESRLILNLERTLFIRHQNGCLTKIAIKFDCFLTIGILPSLYFVVSDSKNLCNR